MAAFLSGIGWLLLIALILFRAAGQFRAYGKVCVEPFSPDGVPSLTVVVPARNEETDIPLCLGGLLSQTYPRDRLEVIVVDDDSTDETVAVARSLIDSHPFLRLLRAGRLPPGWTGKAHACWKGSLEAKGDWLCFLDADTRPFQNLLHSAMSFAKRNGIDMLSLHPRFELRSFWERIVIPNALFVIAFASNLEAVNGPEESKASANGQFILVNAEAYRSVGGHAAVSGQIGEDAALARLIRGAGCRTYLANASELFSVRMYSSLKDLWHGLSKNVIDVVHSAGAGVIFAVGAFAFGWISLLLPLLLWLFSGGDSSGFVEWAGIAFSCLGSATIFAAQMATARFFRIPIWYGLLFPLGLAMVGAVALYGVWTDLSKRVVWKNRTYHSRPSNRL